MAPRDQIFRVFDSGSVRNNSNGLHVQRVIPFSFGSQSMIVPMRFRLVEHDPTFTKISNNLAVFQDIICLPSSYRTLVRKVLKNLHCRLDKECPKLPHWYCPWRKSEELDLGIRFFITYKVTQAYNTIELNEANWKDLIEMFRRIRPAEAVFHVDWWVKNVIPADSVDSCKEESKEFKKEDAVESWEDSVESLGQAW